MTRWRSKMESTCLRRTRQQGGRRQVSQAMRPATEVLRAEMTVQEAAATTQQSSISAWVVCDERGARGILSRKVLEEALQEGAGAKSLADVIPTREFVHVHPDHPLNVALERLGASRLDVLPVVSRADISQLEGIVTLHDVLALYGVTSTIGEGTLPRFPP